MAAICLSMALWELGTRSRPVGLQPIDEPLLQQLGMRMVTPVADQLHPAAQLTDGDRGQKERGVVTGGGLCASR